ncbi:hypothetical protein [Herbaspirillum rubrisubalbicans]|uniref:hypothetical protein n=1 Tax=Herbaspirillum rubrisubalbicans TaxID=80842 RepID=UPI0012FD690F|nr:hypothetical protein [Herbaspirillum rubrisubalbicans]
MSEQGEANQENQKSGATDHVVKAPKIQRQIATTDLPRKTLEECMAVARPIFEFYAGNAAT